MRRPVTIMTSAILALAVTACSDGTAPAAPAAVAAQSPSPAASATPSKAGATYDSAQRLVGALNEAGVACINWERTDNPSEALELGSCYVGSEEVVAALYETSEDAAAEPVKKAALLAGVSDVNVVVGSNWTFSCDSEALCKRIADTFGGQHVYIPA